MTSTVGRQHYKVIGTRPIRPDGLDKVTGRAVYGADVKLPGLLYGAVLRSPHAHARIARLDASRAERAPGVMAVITGADMPVVESRVLDLGETVADLKFSSERIMARDKVVYRGHPVAAVAAAEPNAALEALKLIDVEYEVLRPVLSVDDAAAPDAPVVHADLVGDDVGEEVRNTNLAKHIRFEFGDPDAALRDAAIVVDREFETVMVHQGYIEPQSSTALWGLWGSLRSGAEQDPQHDKRGLWGSLRSGAEQDPQHDKRGPWGSLRSGAEQDPQHDKRHDGKLTVWTTTQGAFNARESIAGVLDMPESDIRVIPTEIGGGFGGKISIYLEPVAALLSKKSGRPVKVTMDRKTVFEATGPTPGSKVRVALGVDAKGVLVGGIADIRYEAGAYPGSPIGPAAMCIFAPYRIPNTRIDAREFIVNKPKTAAYRAPGATQVAFAMESVVDELCERLAMDPLEFRLLNGSKEGDRRADGPIFQRIGNLDVQQAAKSSPHYLSPKSPLRERRGDSPDPGRDRGEVSKLVGRGVATGFWFNGGMQSTVTINVNTDGTVTLVEGSTDIGGTRASIAMQAAEVLGLPAEDVHPLVADTDGVGHTDVTGGSRTTQTTGYAAYLAAQNVVAEMKRRAAKLWDVEPDGVRFEDGVFVSDRGPDQRLTFKDLAGRLDETGGPLSASGAIRMRGNAGGFGTHVVDVAVDPETGKVDILRYTAVQDVGTAVHPAYVEGQMQGGVAQGVGWALNEEYAFNADGVMENSTLLDYRMPTALDLPMIDTIIVEVPNPNHPFGVRGVGETPIVPPVPAIANAIHDATGIRFRTLPIKPSRVLAALKETSRKGAGTQGDG